MWSIDRMQTRHRIANVERGTWHFLQSSWLGGYDSATVNSRHHTTLSVHHACCCCWTRCWEWLFFSNASNVFFAFFMFIIVAAAAVRNNAVLTLNTTSICSFVMLEQSTHNPPLTVDASKLLKQFAFEQFNCICILCWFAIEQFTCIRVLAFDI